MMVLQIQFNVGFLTLLAALLHCTNGENIFHSSSVVLGSAIATGGATGSSNTTTRIIGGTDVAANTYPWFAQGLDSTNSRGCGGMLIAPEYVLSAAHCGSDWTSFEIGTLCLTDINNCNQVRNVKCEM